MEINETILNIPPYLSTHWAHVTAIYSQGPDLCVALENGKTIAIPSLSEEEKRKIFSIHASAVQKMEEETSGEPSPLSLLTGGSNSEENKIRMAIGAMENISNLMQHHAEHSDSPPLPEEIIEKIATIAQTVAPEELRSLPQPEPHCNCLHCQMMRHIHTLNLQEQTPQKNDAEEEVTEEELQFQKWQIEQTGTQIFELTNKLDQNECYHVCLSPIGCTCGETGCEHIIAVLKT